MRRFLYMALVFSCAAWVTSCNSTKKDQGSKTLVIIDGVAPASDPSIPNAVGTGSYDALQLKYSKYINVPPKQITNLQLYHVIDYWLNTPYKWGGTDEKGIDCSAFVQKLLVDGYGIYIQRTSNDQFLGELMNRFASTKHLSEGDLVFFKTLDNGMPVTHVGMYLDNDFFVNSSSSKGVSIASLKDPYWSNRYVAAGRVIVKNKQSAKK